MKFWALGLFILIEACSTSSPPEVHPSGLNITEIKPSRESAIMKQNVLQLAQVYDLSPFLYTKEIHIHAKAIDQSHPVLTLNNKYSNSPHKILATLLHAQFHWWALNHAKTMDRLIVDLKKIYPKQTKAVYVHLVVCYLEFRALKMYLGEKVTRNIIKEFIRRERVRPWVYSQVLVKGQVIGRVSKKFGLIPKALL